MFRVWVQGLGRLGFRGVGSTLKKDKFEDSVCCCFAHTPSNRSSGVVSFW